jgi:hypothetical protein
MDEVNNQRVRRKGDKAEESGPPFSQVVYKLSVTFLSLCLCGVSLFTWVAWRRSAFIDHKGYRGQSMRIVSERIVEKDGWMVYR